MKTRVNEPNQCPNCGKPLPAGALAGLCPSCLLDQGLDTKTSDEARPHRFEPPPLAEVARLFPTLEIQSLLGAGGMGAVYKARQPSLDRLVALKILPAQNAAGVNPTERFNREARALARLSHPNIVAVHEFGQTQGLHFFIMEYVDGANLRQLEQAGLLDPREALRIIPQICDALQYAHDEGVVHRDIKPENVLMDRKGRVKIADFGLAKILGVDPSTLRLTAEGQVMGTPHYMAPEQIERPLAVDHRADIYSLGVVFYEMLTGDLPLGKFAPPSRKVEVDVRLDEVVLRALENDPARRYQQAGDVKTRVETIAGSPVQKGSVTPDPADTYIRWAGFPVVVEHEGVRKINRKGTLQAFGITFGLLTVAFGMVSIVTGRSLFGWIGIAGALSLQMRLLIAALITAWGVGGAFRSKPAGDTRPRTPQGTVVLPAGYFSRKAIAGACLIPFFFIGMTATLIAGMFTRISERLGLIDHWWQGTLGAIGLALGLSAPVATTLLGWMAITEIRRSGGRVSGLGLAVFDGLFFPLLTLDGLITLAWYTCLHLVQGTTPWNGEPVGWVPLIAGATVTCGIVHAYIHHRVWQAVRADAGASLAARDWWWGTPRGIGAIVVSCIVVVGLVADRRGDSGILGTSSVQPVRMDPATGTWVGRLSGGRAVELLALSGPGFGADQWWRPSGPFVRNSRFAIEGPADGPASSALKRFLALKLTGVAPETGVLRYEFDPPANISAGGQVLQNGSPVSGGWPMQAGWTDPIPTASLRIGIGSGSWRTIVTHRLASPSDTRSVLSSDPKWVTSFNHVSDDRTNTHLTIVLSRNLKQWDMRVIAVDAMGAEHPHTRAMETPGDKTSTWTMTFLNLTADRVKEFRVQVQPLEWIEFRGIALNPRGTPPGAMTGPEFGPMVERTFNEFIDLDTGRTAKLPEGDNAPEPFEITPRLLSWMQQNGLDACAGVQKLETLGVTIVDLGASDWDTLKPVELRERLRQSGRFPTDLKSAPPASPPATFGFRTREGGVGLLQLTTPRDGNTRVTVRFKLIPKSPAP